MNILRNSKILSNPLDTDQILLYNNTTAEDQATAKKGRKHLKLCQGGIYGTIKLQIQVAVNDPRTFQFMSSHTKKPLGGIFYGKRTKNLCQMSEAGSSGRARDRRFQYCPLGHPRRDPQRIREPTDP